MFGYEALGTVVFVNMLMTVWLWQKYRWTTQVMRHRRARAFFQRLC